MTQLPDEPSTTFSMDDVVGLLALADSLTEAGVEGDVPTQLRDLAGRIAILCKAPNPLDRPRLIT
jgi:hypothetical protein